MRRSACRPRHSGHRRSGVMLAAAVALAASLTLAGCSTTIIGTATAATHLAPSQSSAETTESSSTETSSTPETTEPSKAPASSTSPIRPMPPMPSISGSGDSSQTTAGTETLDDSSVAWLTAFCTGFSDVASYAGPDTTGLSDAEIVQEIVKTYDAMSAAAEHAELHLQTLPPPTFPGEQRIVPAAIDWFRAVTSVYGQGAQTIESTTFHSLDELSAAIDKVEAGMDPANERFGEAIGEVDPSVTETMRSLPQCAVLASSGG